ncbi:MAG: PAS domain S-box protein [Spirochaetia bacterium]
MGNDAELYKAIFHNNLNPIAIINKQGTYLHANQAFLNFTELTEEQLYKRNAFSFAPKGKVQSQKAEHIDLWEEGGTVETEYLIHGKSKFLVLTITPITYNNEDAVVGVGYDITEKKKAEEQLKEKTKELDIILNTADDYIGRLDKQGLHLYVNQALCGLIGLPFEEYIGKTLSDLGSPKDLADYWMSKLDAVFRTGKPQIFDFTMPTPKQELRCLECKIVPEKLENGETKTVIAISRDITERKNAEQKAQQLLEEKELLLKEVHHRIKNDMNVLRSLLSLQARETEDPGSADLLKEAINRIQVMTNIYQTLFLSGDFQNISLPPLVQEIINGVQDSYRLEKPVQVIEKIENIQISSKASFHIGIIINELLTNAFKYGFPDKGGEVIVSLTLTEDNVLHIMVKDNGIGMPKKKQDPSEWGFGLRLVSILTEQYDGNFTIHSNGETIFLVEIEI